MTRSFYLTVGETDNDDNVETILLSKDMLIHLASLLNPQASREQMELYDGLYLVKERAQ